METLYVKLGQLIDDGNYPPRLVFADFHNGVATILRASSDEEDSDSLIRHVPRIQRLNAAKRRKMLDS